VSLTGSASALRAAPGQPAAGAKGFNVIDAHTHFYDPSRPEGVPWPPREDKLLYRPVWPEDYRALALPQPVTGTVVVEASPWRDDNQWVLDLAANDPCSVDFVGNLPVGTKEFAGHLKRFAANKLFRGTRIRDRKLEGTSDDPAFVTDLKLLAEHDLWLDLVGGREILPYADRLAKEVPGLRSIMDHLAGVVVDGKPSPADWASQMRALVQRPGVCCKLSGLIDGTGRSDGSAPRDVEFYRPVLDAMHSIFGPERLIYDSNWPVSERSASLARCRASRRSISAAPDARRRNGSFRWAPSRPTAGCGGRDRCDEAKDAQAASLKTGVTRPPQCVCRASRFRRGQNPKSAC
jgi:predicted TIM-barrel fold metal-dependent hydrolase